MKPPQPRRARASQYRRVSAALAAPDSPFSTPSDRRPHRQQAAGRQGLYPAFNGLTVTSAGQRLQRRFRSMCGPRNCPGDWTYANVRAT